MTSEQFEKEMTEMMNGVPGLVAAFIRTNAYERGHSAGYEEVLIIAMGLKYDLKRVIKKLQEVA